MYDIYVNCLSTWHGVYTQVICLINERKYSLYEVILFQ
jgi:hypothetical protein